MPPTPEQVTLIAPLSGVLVPIERVPDPVFAEKMVGEAVDRPTNNAARPVDGEVTLSILVPRSDRQHASDSKCCSTSGSTRDAGRVEPQVALGTAVSWATR
jgi:hypothetical protein